MGFAYAALKGLHVGSVGRKYGRTRGVRSAAFGGALATFAYIVSVAVTKSPAGFLEGL
jgi:uncharacterized membrane protein SirB2